MNVEQVRIFLKKAVVAYLKFLARLPPAEREREREQRKPVPPDYMSRT
jgi:hypothetical protein